LLLPLPLLLKPCLLHFAATPTDARVSMLQQLTAGRPRPHRLTIHPGPRWSHRITTAQSDRARSSTLPAIMEMMSVTAAEQQQQQQAASRLP